MDAIIKLPDWKRFNTGLINRNLSLLSDEGSSTRYDDYKHLLEQTLKSKFIIGNIDGYLTQDTSQYERYFSLSHIDFRGSKIPHSDVFNLMRLDTFGRGRFYSMDDIFVQVDRSYGKGFYLDLKKTVEEPVVEFIKTTKENGILVNHDFIVVAPDTHITLLRIIEGTGKCMVLDNVEIYVNKGASIDYVTLNRMKDGGFYSAIKRAQVSKQAKVNWYNIDIENSSTAISTRSMLIEHGAESKMTGIIIGKAESQKDISYETFHNAPDTVTSVLVRAALLDKAKVVYRALTHIASGSKRAKVEQAEKSIMLGNEARFDGIPSLWIDEDDVIASHSASSGMVDEQTMFYLKSRGIPHNIAERIITDGFISSLLLKPPVSLLKDLF